MPKADIYTFLFLAFSSPMQLLNSSELRASNAEKAAYYLDAALAARTRPKNNNGGRRLGFQLENQHEQQLKQKHTHHIKNDLKLLFQSRSNKYAVEDANFSVIDYR